MCKLKQCPRCENEKLEEGQNYCQICGLNLYGGLTKEGVLSQIDSFIDEMQEHIDNDPFDSEAFREGLEALVTVKEVYKRTAQEVPVQEQSNSNEQYFVSERIVNISEFENLISLVLANATGARKFLESNEYVSATKSIDYLVNTLMQIQEFEFYLEHRKVNI